MSITDVRTLIKRERISNPCATLQAIADKANITRERVRQILNDEGLSTRHFVQKYLCLNCGRELLPRQKLYCSEECRYEYTHPIFTCDWCGKLFRIKRSVGKLIDEIRRGQKKRHMFCSKKCQGEWLGHNYGIQTRPLDRLKYMPIPIKHEHLKFQALRLYREGFSKYRIAKVLNIPKGTIYALMERWLREEVKR